MRVTNPGGTINSQPATLVVQPAPVSPIITQNPTNLVVPVGSNATLTVLATGTAPLLYQWFFNGTAIVGATIASSITGSGAGSGSGGSKVTHSGSIFEVIAKVDYGPSPHAWGTYFL